MKFATFIGNIQALSYHDLNSTDEVVWQEMAAESGKVFAFCRKIPKCKAGGHHEKNLGGRN